MVRLGSPTKERRNTVNRLLSASDLDRITNNLSPEAEGGLSRELLIRLGGHAINALGREQRSDYQYFRAANLGALAYNTIIGEKAINAGDLYNQPLAHFGAYNYALHVARAIAYEGAYSETQFPPHVREVVDDYLQIPKTHLYPSIIFALEPEYTNTLRESDMGAGHGVIYDGIVTLDMIDKRSREAIKQFTADL